MDSDKLFVSEHSAKQTTSFHFLGVKTKTNNTPSSVMNAYARPVGFRADDRLRRVGKICANFVNMRHY